MAEVAPSIPNAHYIRVYPDNYAASETGSEGEPHFEMDSQDEDLISISTRLDQNQQYMDKQLALPTGHASDWLLEPQAWQTTEGTDVVLIRKPTASHMSHRPTFPQHQWSKLDCL